MQGNLRIAFFSLALATRSATGAIPCTLLFSHDSLQMQVMTYPLGEETWRNGSEDGRCLLGAARARARVHDMTGTLGQKNEEIKASRGMDGGNSKNVGLAAAQADVVPGDTDIAVSETDDDDECAKTNLADPVNIAESQFRPHTSPVVSRRCSDTSRAFGEPSKRGAERSSHGLPATFPGVTPHPGPLRISVVQDGSHHSAKGAFKSVELALYVCLGVLLFALLAVIGLLWWQHKASEIPLRNLRSYVNTDLASKPVKKIGSLLVDEFDIYAQSVCVEGKDADALRRGLRANLRIPESAKEEIIKRAVVDKASSTSSLQDTKVSIDKQGYAHSFMVFWSTQYVGSSPLFASAYYACVMTAGAMLNIAEDVAGFEESKEEIVLGHEPCHRGYLWCARCPIKHERITRTPIFKRSKLTLDAQVELHNFMEASAFKSALALVGTQGYLQASLEKEKPSSWGSPAAPWKRPNENVFLGPDSPDDASLFARARPEPAQKDL
ncbi:hypothetical protein FVE85_8744 [Porphyridium purpureum]|uniref:Transmembrane protein n=1 Tax=Porphyridium purpureum TaxID=35688 RepID=A0A5J4YPC4_PORPP|nr:hypothetical protein FVE85_8744 [Porphyridium purpureum]|eukprot:POR8710..scf296_7